MVSETVADAAPTTSTFNLSSEPASFCTQFNTIPDNLCSSISATKAFGAPIVRTPAFKETNEVFDSHVSKQSLET